MKITTFDGSQERRVLIGMITDPFVLGRIASKWERGLFSSKWASLVANWSVNYFKKYSKEPGRGIEALFERWKEISKDPDSASLVERFLESISDEYVKGEEERNSELIIDMAGELFRKNKSQSLADGIRAAVEANDLSLVDKLLNAYHRIELGQSSYVNVFDYQGETEEIKACFKDSEESIIKLDGDLGRFFGEDLGRDCFVAMMAPEKAGKTFCLMNLAYLASVQGLKVAFFEVGDMSRKQIWRRFLSRDAKKCLRPCKRRFPTKMEVRVDNEGKEIAEVEHEEKEIKSGMDFDKVSKTSPTFAKNLRLWVYSNDTCNVEMINENLRAASLEGFEVDCIFIDYADILAPLPGMTSDRDGINATWKRLRALSQDYHCLLVTGTQANAESYERHTMDRRHFSEDKRKLAHCTGTVGINVTAEEKRRGVFRLNWVVLREGEFSTSKCVHVAHCLSICNPFVISRFAERD